MEHTTQKLRESPFEGYQICESLCILNNRSNDSKYQFLYGLIDHLCIEFQIDVSIIIINAHESYAIFPSASDIDSDLLTIQSPSHSLPI